MFFFVGKITCENVLQFFSFSKFLYPRPQTVMDADGDTVMAGSSDGKYELFSQVDKVIIEEIKGLILDGEIFCL